MNLWYKIFAPKLLKLYQAVKQQQDKDIDDLYQARRATLDSQKCLDRCMLDQTIRSMVKNQYGNFSKESYNELKAYVDIVHKELDKYVKAIRKHRDQRGDDRCWMDDYELYEVLPEGINGADLRLNTPEEMLSCCKQFVASRHDPSKEYISPQRRIDELEKENMRLSDKLRKFNQK